MGNQHTASFFAFFASGLSEKSPFRLALVCEDDIVFVSVLSIARPPPVVSVRTRARRAEFKIKFLTIA